MESIYISNWPSMRAYDKNMKLKDERWISFEDVIECISTGALLDVIEHENQEKYNNQKKFIIEFRGYIYFVPYIESGNCIIWKTIIPRRQLMKKYLFH